jgi:hypothetical protein
MSETVTLRTRGPRPVVGSPCQRREESKYGRLPLLPKDSDQRVFVLCALPYKHVCEHLNRVCMTVVGT